MQGQEAGAGGVVIPEVSFSRFLWRLPWTGPAFQRGKWILLYIPAIFASRFSARPQLEPSFTAHGDACAVTSTKVAVQTPRYCHHSVSDNLPSGDLS